AAEVVAGDDHPAGQVAAADLLVAGRRLQEPRAHRAIVEREEPRRVELVGVDVVTHDQRLALDLHAASPVAEAIGDASCRLAATRSSSTVRGSQIVPVSAAAAAVSGDAR